MVLGVSPVTLVVPISNWFPFVSVVTTTVFVGYGVDGDRIFVIVNENIDDILVDDAIFIVNIVEEVQEHVSVPIPTGLIQDGVDTLIGVVVTSLCQVEGNVIVIELLVDGIVLFGVIDTDIFDAVFTVVGLNVTTQLVILPGLSCTLGVIPEADDAVVESAPRVTTNEPVVTAGLGLYTL